MAIRTLFDPSKNIHRTIEKVITYGASQEHRLKSEISEYIVTDSIEAQFRKLLDRMQHAMEVGGENEIGVWVSGFYGSGKSSFTKYLGLSFDGVTHIDGVPFIKHLQDRLHNVEVKALLTSVSNRFPAAVVLLDLASEMLAGATMEDVSTVLYYKVLQWAGYSRNLKVAALERRIESDGRRDEFINKLAAVLPGVPWKDLQNDPLAVDGLIPQIAHEMYPALFPTTTSFTTSTEGFFQFEDQRVKEMLDIVRQKSGKEHILFIVDEVGQYVASRDNLILNLDGLAKNLKRIGDGKAWIIATAQQTLTEDDPRASLNSPQLFKLKDRFPIQVDLESSDIREICYKRLLGKSPAGADVLGKRFDAHGQGLRHNTKLQDAKYYDADFSKETFINLYPFLPAHFDILLHLLGALAKSTGGIGLRSAIKVIQDILVEGVDGKNPVADQPVGWLATTVTLYDALDKDIRRAFPSIFQAFDKVRIGFPDSPLHLEIGKSVAVLQILGNIPVTVHNLASLMHPSIDAPSRVEDIRMAVEEMLNDPIVPLGSKDGHLCFLSEKLRDIEQERGKIPVRSIEARRIFNEALRENFNPLPSARVMATLAATSGLKIRTGTQESSLAGEREEVQTMIELVDTADFDTTSIRLLEESRQRTGQSTIFLLGRTSHDTDNLVSEIYRCQRIVELHRTDPDQEVKDYCVSQIDRAAILNQQLQQQVKRNLAPGSFIFRGQATAVSSLDQEVLEAAKKMMVDVAAQVFDRYGEAPVRVDTSLAEQFLKAAGVNLGTVTAKIDPLGLVQTVGGTTTINTSQKALVSIRDHINQNGSVEGRRLLDKFSEAPFGWSQDTLRYICAAMLVAGEIKLKVSGREVTAVGQHAIESLKTNNSFKPIGLSLRDERPPIEMLAKAAERLTELLGEPIIPLEQEINKAAVKHLPRFQNDFAPLGEKLNALDVAGSERLRSVTKDITDILFIDASDAPQRLGGKESVLYDNLKWAGEVKRALEHGLEATIRDLQYHSREIKTLPANGIPGELRNDLKEELDQIRQRLGRDDFQQHAADLATTLTGVRARVVDTARQMATTQQERIRSGIEDLQRLPEWPEFTQEEQQNVIAQVEKMALAATEDMAGLKQLLSRDYEISTTLGSLRERIQCEGQERKLMRLEGEKPKGATKLQKAITIPTTVTTSDQLNDLIRQLKELIEQAPLYQEIEVTITLKGQ
jgi:hypothetical protein